MYFHDPTVRQPKELATGVNTRTFWGENVRMSIVDFDPNCVVPHHTHPHEQAGIMLEGELDMKIGGEEKHIKQGDVYIIPGNVVHGGRAGSSPARALDIFSPVREEFKY